ncbi:hypothetical protein JCM5296_004726 [Sporobolomyces johnsonii]
MVALAPAVDGSSASRPTPRARLTSSSSDFVLLTTSSPLLAPHAPPHSTHVPLPHPRYQPLLQLAALADFAFVLAYGATVPLSSLPKSAVALSLARSVVVGAAVSSSRVREMAPVLMGQVMVSALVLLFRINELVQTNSLASPSTPSPSRVPVSVPSSSPSPAPSPAPAAIPLSHLLNPTTLWYLSSFLFSLVHYVLYLFFVGVRRRRNPFVGRGGGGGLRRRLQSEWGEQRWEGREESVGRPGSVRSARSGQEEEVGEEEEEEGFLPGAEEAGEAYDEAFDEEGEEEDDLSSSSEDDDDIIDIPRVLGGTLRSRTSRASLLSTSPGARSRLEEPMARPQGLRASKGYGSIKSLAGI